MARILGLWNSALKAARGGMTASQWYSALRTQGVAPRSSEAFALFRVAVKVAAGGGNETSREQSAVPRPGPGDIWPTKNATGIRQNVTLAYRNRATGVITQTYWSTISEKGVTRQEAVEAAINSYSDHADEYDQDLIMAVHSSAYRLRPDLFS